MSQEITSKEITEKADTLQTKADKPWLFKKGQSGNPKGKKKMTQQEKEIKKATKELIKDYTDKLTEALPQISPVLIAKAISGELPAIKEINDRILGKPKESHDITSGGETMGVIFLPRRKQDETKQLDEPKI